MVGKKCNWCISFIHLKFRFSSDRWFLWLLVSILSIAISIGGLMNWKEFSQNRIEPNKKMKHNCEFFGLMVDGYFQFFFSFNKHLNSLFTRWKERFKAKHTHWKGKKFACVHNILAHTPRHFRIYFSLIEAWGYLTFIFTRIGRQMFFDGANEISIDIILCVWEMCFVRAIIAESEASIYFRSERMSVQFTLDFVVRVGFCALFYF